MKIKVQKIFNRRASATPKKALMISCVAALAGLAACSGPTAMNKQLADREGYIKPSPSNEVSATPFIHAVSLTPGQIRLDGNQSSSLSNFLSSVGRDRGDHYEIRTSYTTADPAISGRNNHVARELRSSFIAQGVYAERIQLVHVPGHDNTLELIIRRYSVISPACGVIDVNQGIEWEDSPVQVRDLGCSNAYNLGQMLADPRDLVGGRALTASPGEREAIGVRQHGTGTIPGLATETTSTTGQ